MALTIPAVALAMVPAAPRPAAVTARAAVCLVQEASPDLQVVPPQHSALGSAGCDANAAGWQMWPWQAEAQRHRLYPCRWRQRAAAALSSGPRLVPPPLPRRSVEAGRLHRDERILSHMNMASGRVTTADASVLLDSNIKPETDKPGLAQCLSWQTLHLSFEQHANHVA